MYTANKPKYKRGFTMAELVIVVAIIAILSCIAIVFINPQDLSYTEYNRSAEAIATAVQNRLTEIRNSGDMAQLRALGESASKSGIVATAGEASGSDVKGGYRYVFNYEVVEGAIVKKDISYILPFGTIEYNLSQHYFAIGFQADTGMVGEVFYSEQPIGDCSVSYLLTLSGDEPKKQAARKAANVGYYKGTVDAQEVAFANLPTPQLTIVNSEELTLSIYLPAVKQLQDMGKQIGILVSLSDKNGKIYSEKKLEYSDTAIYSTYPLGDAAADNVDPSEPSVVSQEITSGTTYKIILDTVKKCNTLDLQKKLGAEGNPSQASDTPPKGKFEDWAKKSAAYDEGTFELGDNSVITVTVYCLYSKGDSHYKENYPVDPTYIPRSASVTFNGWFDNYNSSSVDISCGRHLQNLGNMTVMQSALQAQLPTVEEHDGVYTYGNYNYGMAKTYTDGSSRASESVDYDTLSEKYDRRKDVKSISKANQINAIDFDCEEWKEDGKRIPFTPVNLPHDFYYYGNYLTINHLYVDAPFYAGLFGYVYHPRLYDILLVNPSVNSQMPARLAELYEMGVGALVGTSRNSSHINNCQVYMTQEDGTYHPDKYRVTGEGYVGGLIGFGEDEDLESCSASVYTGYAKGATKTVDGVEVSVSSKYVGGLIGAISGDSTIQNCYAAGNLSGQYVGGLVGFIVEDSDTSGDDYRISTCYTAGHIEYASEQAAGILGCVRELAGNAKSALSIYNNYCAIIYGEKQGSGYAWTATKKVGGSDVPVPIYGTFKGDGYEWLRTETLGFSDTYLTGKYAGKTFFAGAVFANDNRNYYIAQNNINYSSSPYYTAMKDVVEQFLKDISDAKGNVTLLEQKIKAAQDQIVWLKKMQTLEQLKEAMENILYEVENETGLDPDGDPYNEGGFYEYPNNKGKIYFDTSRARVEGKERETSHTYEIMTLLQALHVIYDGTYTDSTGTHTVTMTYGGSDSAKQKLNSYGIYTFMDYYNFLNKTYGELVKEGATEAEKTAARQKLVDILGNNTTETYEEANEKGVMETHNFYEKGLFYRHFYSDLLYRLIDKAKDYYQENAKDNTGELIYRHFRDLVESRFLYVLVDLGISPTERDNFLNNVKKAEVQQAIDSMTDYLTICDEWKGPMKSYAADAKGYITSAKTALETLLKDLDDPTITTEKLQKDIDAADTPLESLYDLLDAHKAANQSTDTGDWDAVDKDGTKGDMRKLRDPVAIYRRSIALCVASANSGVENALEELAAKLAQHTDAATAVDEFTKNVNTYLGEAWGYADSGHMLRDSEELRNAARGFIYGRVDSERESSLGFMYDYQNNHSGNPYTFTHDAYVDGDNGIYNNVFPYTENAFTSYYPLPFVYGMKVEGSEFRASYVLFHYGDWLTEDLWVNSTINYHTDYPEIADFDGEPIVLPSELVTASDAETFEPDDVDIRARDEDIDTPFYFEGWYMDAALTIPYSNEYYQQIKDNALNGNESKTFDLYAKWITKPSLTFYAGDLKGSSGLINITVDTTMTLDVLNNDSKVSNKDNSYQKYTVWLKPGQNVTISVKGSYYYNLTYNEDGPVLEKGSEPIYIIDSLTIVSPTEFTGTAPWFDESNIVKEKGTVTFSVPAKATAADNYELTLSAELGSGDGGSQFTLCLAEGTMIRMADGSLKSIETLEVGDMVLAFNHSSGRYEATALLMNPHTELGAKLYNVTTLSFSDGYTLRIVGEHGLFDRTLNKYVFINETNYSQYIGHKFSAVSVSGSIVEDRTVTLKSVSVDGEITRIYSPITENHLNIVADDLLTVTSMMGYGDAVVNIFAYNADMSFDLEQMNADISKYGVYGYDDFADLLPQEVWDKVPLGIMKVAVGKGLISYEEVRQIVIYIYENGYLS